MLYERGKAYSQDLRERVFAASDDGEQASISTDRNAASCQARNSVVVSV
jgi:hypothetical protein